MLNFKNDQTTLAYIYLENYLNIRGKFQDNGFYLWDRQWCEQFTDSEYKKITDKLTDADFFECGDFLKESLKEYFNNDDLFFYLFSYTRWNELAYFYLHNKGVYYESSINTGFLKLLEEKDFEGFLQEKENVLWSDDDFPKICEYFIRENTNDNPMLNNLISFIEWDVIYDEYREYCTFV